MSEYRFLCPQCGQSFTDESGVTSCPQCQIPVLRTVPSFVALQNLPMPIDIDELMGRVLAEQTPGEEIEAAIQRIVQREYPDAHEDLFRLISEFLRMNQQLRGGTRQEAAEQLARTESELKVQPGGMPEIRMMQTFGEVRGLEDFSPDVREQIMTKLRESLESGKPIQKLQLTIGGKRSRTGCASVLIAVVVGIGWSMWILCR